MLQVCQLSALYSFVGLLCNSDKFAAFLLHHPLIQEFSNFIVILQIHRDIEVLTECVSLPKLVLLMMMP